MTRYLIHVLLFVLSFFLPSLCLSEETITGHYCYTYGDRETIEEARKITLTLSIRNGIESYRVFIESIGRVSNFALTNDLIQTISSGYLKNVKVLEHTEQGRTICDKISGIVIPEEIDRLMRKEVERRKRVDDKGVDNNGHLKIVRVYDTHNVKPLIQLFGDRTYNYVNVVTTPLYDTECSKIAEEKRNIFVTFYDSSDNPLNTEKKLFCVGNRKIYRDEIKNIKFIKPNDSSNYRVWLHSGE